VLRPLEDLIRAQDRPELLVGLLARDDAAVYKISDEVAIIQTLDFFPPVVDDPYDYGAVAAANAMSDVYAMGGEVVLALNIACFPPDLPPAVITEILRGGAEKVAEAGGVLAGGHTLDDEEPKYGLAVMGMVHPDQVLSKGGAQPGDVLALTKPLGSGIVTTALKGEVARPEDVEAAVESMVRLSNKAARIARQIGVHACTDVTGFALLGHGCEMAERSSARLRLRFEELPFLPGAKGYAEDWLFPAGTCHNQDGYADSITFAPTISEEMQMLMLTPETSGGLLLALDPAKVDRLMQLCLDEDQLCWIIGCVEAGAGVEVV
jgi:selenide,water dikinase